MLVVSFFRWKFILILKGHLGFEFGDNGFHDMAGSSPTGVDVADKQTRLDLKHFHSWVFVRIMGMINQNILGIRFDKIDFVWINSKIYEIENLRSSKHRLPLIGSAGHQVLSNSWSSFPHLSSLKD